MRSKKRRLWRWWVLAAACVLVLAGAGFVWFWNLLPARAYTAEDFDIETLVSPYDANGNGVDDYADIVAGARLDAENHPRYDGSYWEGGYPPGDVGVCTDTVWRAFEYAGYDLKVLVDADIAARPETYPGLDESGPDPNIDFRRVRNLDVFFAQHAEVLTLDLSDPAQWQPGDIVVFEKVDHIAICSDKRNADGLPWLIHNGGQPKREENALQKLTMTKELVGHYRWTPTDVNSGSEDGVNGKYDDDKSGAAPTSASPPETAGLDIQAHVSPNDANGNGVDDYADIVAGARLDAENHPRYDGGYWEGGYPPDDVGVCTDTVWRAFEFAGYDLKALVDADIAANPAAYPGVGMAGPDPNIDFRRVRNLDVFFMRHGESLTLDLSDAEAWQPGDIVVFADKDHIAICSDRRNAEGLPWLIHNAGQVEREEDALYDEVQKRTLIGHYRWTPAAVGDADDA